MALPTAVQVADVIERHMQTTNSSGYPACLQEDWDCDDSVTWDYAAYRSHAEHVAASIVASMVVSGLMAGPPSDDD